MMSDENMVKNKKRKRERKYRDCDFNQSNRSDIYVYCKYTLIKFYERERSKANKPIDSVKSQHVYV